MLRLVSVGLCCLTLVLLTGCPFAASDARTSNQGGGSLLLTALPKVLNGQMTQLNPDELQLLSDFILEQAPTTTRDTVETLSDDVAEALSWFIDDNDINTLDDVTYLIEHPDQIVVSDDVEQFLNSDDAEQLLELFFGADLSGIAA